MARYLLDTSHASPLVTWDHPLRQKFLRRVETGDFFAICLPVLVETMFGIGIIPKAKRNLIEWNSLRPTLPCFVPNEDDGIAAADLQIRLRKSGVQLFTNDALIAITGLRNNLVVLSTDGVFKRIPELKTENWMTIASR